MPAPEPRLTYEQALRAAERFKGQFGAETYKRWVFCGGIRRHDRTMADVVHLVDPQLDVAPLFDPEAKLFGENRARNLLWVRLDQMVAAGMLRKRYLADGAPHRLGYTWHEHYRVVVFEGVVHRIFSADRRNWGLALYAATGHEEETARTIAALEKRGYKLRPGLMLAGSKGAVLEVPSEEHVSKLAGQGTQVLTRSPR